MKETIVTIPINDLFAPKDGCPLCRMERMLEDQYCEFVTGDAMMEPSVSIETNKRGFCHRHFSKMTRVGQKLPNALILESHLQEIMEQLIPKKAGKPDKKQLEALDEMLRSCYVCDRVEARHAPPYGHGVRGMGKGRRSSGRPSATSRLFALTTTALL